MITPAPHRWEPMRTHLQGQVADRPPRSLTIQISDPDTFTLQAELTLRSEGVLSLLAGGTVHATGRRRVPVDPAPTRIRLTQQLDLDTFVKACLDARVGHVQRRNVVDHAYTVAGYLQTSGVQFLCDGIEWSLEGMSQHGWRRMVEGRGLIAQEG